MVGLSGALHGDFEATGHKRFKFSAWRYHGCIIPVFILRFPRELHPAHRPIVLIVSHRCQINALIDTQRYVTRMNLYSTDASVTVFLLLLALSSFRILPGQRLIKLRAYVVRSHPKAQAGLPFPADTNNRLRSGRNAVRVGIDKSAKRRHTWSV